MYWSSSQMLLVPLLDGGWNFEFESLELPKGSLSNHTYEV